MQSPFKFLDAYQKEDYARFFGREKETAQLYNAVFASNLTLFYGASGTGKTSLVNCGLGNKFYDTDWLPLFIRREENLNNAFDAAIFKALNAKEAINISELNIKEKTEKLYLKYYKPVYFIFDQFEELYILGSKQEQQKFYKTIAQLLQEDLQAKVLIIIREEWIAYLDEFEKVIPSVFENRLRVEKMNDQNIYRVISRTCQYEKITIKNPAKTIMAIIQNLRGKRERVDLTNLQVYLDRLYTIDIERQKDKNTMAITFDLALVEKVGKMENVLSHFLDEQMDIIESNLHKRGIKNTKGLPLEILFTLVTEDGTKQALSPQEIIEALPTNHKIGVKDLEYCMEEFQRIKLLRALE